MTDALSDPVFLSRLQFAATTMFHILWPLTTIGLSVFLVALEALWLGTGDPDYYRHCRFWARIFAVGFAVGVVSGIPLEFQFGTNWAPFSVAAGNFFGQVLSFEGAMAFMLESAFLSIMLFGWKRVGPWAHFLSTVLVCFAASLSAFWIMAANSWMQTPAGGRFVDGVFQLEDFWAAVFNPDTVISFSHMWLACLQTSLFLAGGVSAFYIWRGRHTAFFLRSFSLAAAMVLVVAPLQALVGDTSGVHIGKLQPAKVAAIESHWETNKPGEGASWNIVAWPDPENERNAFEIRVPYVLSLLITHTPTGTVPGLKDFPKEDRPPIVIPFYAFRAMVGIGFAMVALALVTVWAWRKGLLAPDGAPRRKLLLGAWMAMAPLGYVATEMGWATREVGRQPWVIHGLLRTSDGASILPAEAVWTSLAMYGAVYTILPLMALWFFGKILAKGPDLTLQPPAAARKGA
ncbi:Cytochrome bd-II ubiquinol oxidase subunit 1 [Fundidesulfovibrio magnetotacticus]|uniref:Cytochrome bd-II ubiquinol oxidase subunit 1 n=1 Tax=Fundidesulfovibrio magnetotacticus TaxID=2730080 RepID=A0A6V8LRK1_9BACT|nr:cytochrome ubiquinol oxidase subunit I [Fundidesulfovibrio magnetotacticus]GFK93600.1 Cytochrome bd-II ubiquinol oxidase subunit 1 [Fundidesulfovibrio magnetotacticus]